MIQLTDIRKPIEAELQSFGKLYDSALSQRDGILGKICEGISQNKGKLMRPILLMLVAKEWGRVEEPALHAAITMELLHNATLVHDDIVDESDERRGKPSMRSLFGNKAAVLAGDYLLSSALEHASLTGNITVVHNVSLLGKELSEGEILQLFNTRFRDLSEDTYFEIIRLKTATFFATAARLGAIVNNAGDEMINQMSRLGEVIGLCFQIRDDIFDYYDNTNIGKPTGADMAEGKLTLPALYAINSTQDAAMLAIAAKVKQGTASKQEIADLVEFTKQHGGIDYAQDYMARLSAEAKSLIANLQNTEIKAALTAYIDFVSARTM